MGSIMAVKVELIYLFIHRYATALRSAHAGDTANKYM